jgi:glyoxylase-like metal-dependent hydrolase (beta-lactamase superfamily II)
MPAKQILPNFYVIPLGPVNTFLFDDHGELTLIDTAYPNSADKIAAEIRGLGKRVEDVRHILLTHCHPDHAGSLADLKRLTGATAYAHAMDARVVRGQDPMGTPIPSPGLMSKLLFNMLIKGSSPIIPNTEVEHEVGDGEELPVAGGLRAIFTPGHSRGHLAYLWPQHGGVLIAGDIASNMLGLGHSIIYEDFAAGQRTLAKIGQEKFEVAVFGHGGAIMQGAAGKFREKWGGKA